MSTSITIELTGEMVTALRVWMRQPVPEGESSFHIPTVVATLAANQLPPPDRTLAVTLPGPLAAELAKFNCMAPNIGIDVVTANEAVRAVVRALNKDMLP